MHRRARVHFENGFTGEAPRISAEAGDRSRNFTELARAIRWAERRADRVTVVIDDLGVGPEKVVQSFGRGLAAE